MTTLETRLARLEAARAVAMVRDPVKDWRDLYRAGASVEERNRIAGPAWVAMAIQRQAEAEETMVTYGDD